LASAVFSAGSSFKLSTTFPFGFFIVEYSGYIVYDYRTPCNFASEKEVFNNDKTITSKARRPAVAAAREIKKRRTRGPVAAHATLL
jgi:hypothetical protein